MEDKYLSTLRAKLLNSRYSEALEYLKKDLLKLKADGYSYDLLLIFVEETFGIKMENREKFRYSMRKRINAWEKKGAPSGRAVPSPPSIAPPKKDGMELVGGFPAFLHYDPSKEPKKENGLDRLSRAIEEQAKLEKEYKSGVPDSLRYDRSMEPPKEDIFTSIRKEIEQAEKEQEERRNRMK